MKHKRKQAAALSYDNTQYAPMVKAKGQGFIAEDIIKQAKQHNIPILEDPSLVEVLGQIDLNRTIPPELYQAVAEVFAFIYKVDQDH